MFCFAESKIYKLNVQLVFVSLKRMKKFEGLDNKRLKNNLKFVKKIKFTSLVLCNSKLDFSGYDKCNSS